jgi:uncharacterized membrane protein YsdA (DUF1294 family)
MQRGTSFTLATIFIAAVCAGFDLGMIPAWVSHGYLLLTLLTLVAYGLDKEKAERGEWRTTESLLHLMAAAGGWPGAILAQQLFRHKTRKPWFQAMTWFIVAAHIAFWSWAVAMHKVPWPKFIKTQAQPAARSTLLR